MAGNNEAFRLNLLGRAEHHREVELMAEWPAPDPQAWQPPAPATSQPDLAAWTPPTWEELVRDHGARVYRLAYRLTGNPHDAEDLTQDVFVRVFRSLHRFQPWARSKAGCIELRPTCSSTARGVGRRSVSTGWPTGRPSALPSSWPNPSDQLADADLDHDVAAALSALPPEFRAAVVLCDIEGPEL
jgi:RNA polymerase sigma-70 factor (ECF subfamily)